MDPREKLRRYLVQRRELGESELVLDQLSVDEALRLVGEAKPRPPAADQERPRRVARDSMAGSGFDDWREALRAADAAGLPTAAAAEGPPVPAGPVDGAAARGRAAAEGPERGAAPSPAQGATSPEAARGAEPRAAERAAPLPGIDAPAGLSVGSVTAEMFGTAVGGLATLADVADAARACTRCPLHATATQAVPGEGNPNADFVCVGEAPGESEDQTGRPFVGASGQLLTKILAAINLGREDVFICNVIKHRPPGNRNPRPEEVEACSPYLVRQLELIRPKVILALGTFAAQTLLDTKSPIGKLRGQVHRYYGTPLVVTYHPAALLRNPAWKRPTWEDVQLARRILDRAAGA